MTLEEFRDKWGILTPRLAVNVSMTDPANEDKRDIVDEMLKDLESVK